MDKEDIHLGDWERILIGNNPWGFMIEVFFRTLIIYVCLIIVMRLLGKRMNAQLTITDLAVMLTLGAIASVPMQSFDKGILPGIILLITILLLHQGLTYLTSKNRSVEILTQGKVTLLAKEGVIDPEELQRLRISKDQVFAILRSQGIRHLGQVKRLYSEADGHFSVYKLDDAKPGLSVFPRSENDLPTEKKEVPNQQACCYCGYVVDKPNEPHQSCRNCGNEDWMPAVQ